MAHENKPTFELVDRFMSDQRVILRAVVMNAIEKAIQNGMSPEESQQCDPPAAGLHLQRRRTIVERDQVAAARSVQPRLKRALRNLLDAKREATQEGLGQSAEQIATAIRLIDATHKLLAQDMSAAMREVL